MNRRFNLLTYEILSTIFILILGFLLHFTFEWSNKNVIIGIFSSINESTWEHLKILFFPMLLSTIMGYFYFGKEIPNYLCYKTKGILIASIFIIIFFYVYTGIIGKSYIILDIGSFIVGVIIGEYYTYKKIISNSKCNNIISIIILFILSLSFILFTFYPPHINLFKDPKTGDFGYNKTYE